MKAFVFIAMIFCHIVDDYYLQGILAKMKQKSWWRKQENYNDYYRFDYIVGLLMHSLSWAFMIMLPIALYLHFQIDWVFGLTFVINAIIHCIIDDLKANKKIINLVLDQTVHIVQICATYAVFMTAMI